MDAQLGYALAEGVGVEDRCPVGVEPPWEPVAAGGGKMTELTIVQENIPPQIPAEFCYLGWQESLSLLTLLVEAEVP